MSDPHTFFAAGPGTEPVDDAISALLDNDFEGWAHDHGLDPEAARRALQSRPEFSDRYTAIDTARHAVRVDERDELDEVTRRRMVDTALGAAPAHSRRWQLLAAAAAVVVIAVGAAAFAATRDSSTQHTASRTVAADAYRGNLGDVTDPATLRGLVDGAHAPVPQSFSASQPAADAAGTASSAATKSAGAVPATPSAAARAATLECARIALRRAAPGSRLTETGQATFRGAVVVVAVIRDAHRVTTLVLDPASCTPVASQSQRRR